ncbi:YeeE/YedE family protein [Verrucomicrobiaceae bacterium R5-34]|nr:YeeE/YedE family protein [Verrucomicrobiaceae bacterium R5-34]
MNIPIAKDSIEGLVLAATFGLVFGVLLNKGRVTDYNVIVNLFRLKDFTVMKIMLTAIVVGGIGVALMINGGLIEGYQVKPANLLGVIIGSGIFGVGMALYGYCPGTAVAAIATGRLHALMGLFGMLVGGIAYALSFSWVKEHILNVWSQGKVRLPDVTAIPTAGWWVILVAIAATAFTLIEKMSKKA